jgi:hypothetical protein
MYQLDILFKLTNTFLVRFGLQFYILKRRNKKDYYVFF